MSIEKMRQGRQLITDRCWVLAAYRLSNASVEFNGTIMHLTPAHSYDANAPQPTGLRGPLNTQLCAIDPLIHLIVHPDRSTLLGVIPAFLIQVALVWWYLV